MLFIPACATPPAPPTPLTCDIPESLLMNCVVVYSSIKTNGDLLLAYIAALEELERCSIDKALIRGSLQ